MEGGYIVENRKDHPIALKMIWQRYASRRKVKMKGEMLKNAFVGDDGRS